ncbi:Nuclear hormone receptor family member nhr-10 [Halotydeus destructor]|nr:Nuclear hormone receptor family member nhr-10 [Halotydeus destructor]
MFFLDGQAHGCTGSCQALSQPDKDQGPYVGPLTTLASNGAQVGGMAPIKKRYRDRGHFECEVCGAEATKYNFGVVSCNACRQFFKRIVTGEKQSKLPACRHFGRCPVLPDNRKNCMSCRYSKCLQVGMRANLVKMPIKAREYLELSNVTMVTEQDDSGQDDQLDAFMEMISNFYAQA